MLHNLLTKDNDYINDIIEKHFNKEIENNPNLSKFKRNICHLCNKKYLKTCKEPLSLFWKNAWICTQ